MNQTCKTCLIEKPVAEFWKQRAKKTGIQAECKECMRTRNNRWYAKNKSPELAERNRDATNKKRRTHPKRSWFVSLKARAKQTGKAFDLTPDDVPVPLFCPVLGMSLRIGLGRGWGHGLSLRDATPSVDRIDNKSGYVRGNVVVVSYRANRIKSDATAKELRAIADFYGRLENGRAGRSSRFGHPNKSDGGKRENALPPVQPYEEAYS